MAAAQRDVPRVRILDVLEGELITRNQVVHARVAGDGIAGVEFWFAPEDGRGQPIFIGADREALEPSYGPVCGDTREVPCVRNDEYSVQLGRALARVPEGSGRLSVRFLGSLVEEASVRAYWDPTPPRARIRSPRFNAQFKKSGWQVVAKTQDEDVISINVKWLLANAGGRNIPLFEQEVLGFSFAGHAACVPTTVGANFKWLHITSQLTTIPGFVPASFADQFLVNSLGFFMLTDTSGTTAAGAVDGTVAYLDFWFAYQNGNEYKLEHLGAPDFGASSTQFGFSPEQILEQFQAGGAISVGFHNLPLLPGNLFEDPPFGHILALDNVTLNSNGTASIRVMDPHANPHPTPNPPATVGTYRTFILNPNGTVEWLAANPGYYNPFATGQVALDYLHIVRDTIFFTDLSLNASITQGEVPGRMVGSRTWVGHFTPPTGSPGPWLLVTESTDASGHMQRDYQYVGGPSRSRRTGN